MQFNHSVLLPIKNLTLRLIEVPLGEEGFREIDWVNLSIASNPKNDVAKKSKGQTFMKVVKMARINPLNYALIGLVQVTDLHQ